jgi:hypothetical protein
VIVDEDGVEPDVVSVIAVDQQMHAGVLILPIRSIAGDTVPTNDGQYGPIWGRLSGKPFGKIKRSLQALPAVSGGICFWPPMSRVG